MCTQDTFIEKIIDEIETSNIVNRSKNTPEEYGDLLDKFLVSLQPAT